jgi:LysM repeat protein
MGMTKSLWFSLAFLFTIQFAAAQKKELILKRSEKSFYLDHSVAAKESFYSIGRLYNVHPRHLASFNKLDMAKGIFIDQVVRIPLTDSNFTQQGNTGTPVYYMASDNEELSKISSVNNNVTLTSLRNWNNLTNDNLSSGTKLIVGFLKTKGMPSVTITTAVKQSEPVVKNEEKQVPVKPKVKTEVKGEEKPLAVVPAVEEKPVVKTEEPAKAIPNKVIPNAIMTEVSPAVATVDQGYFKRTFDQQVKGSPISKNETVTAGIFKTTSGWQDAKYYLLIDKVAPGTIVKVINPANNKAVFAKVLGEMSGIRQNEGMDIRISNAAAAALGITEQDKYIVKVNY